MELHWEYLVFLWLFVIAEMADVKALKDANDSLSEISRGGWKPTADQKSGLASALARSLFYTLAVASAIAVMVFFVKRHL